jgi:hypothetical protein
MTQPKKQMTQPKKEITQPKETNDAAKETNDAAKERNDATNERNDATRQRPFRAMQHVFELLIRMIYENSGKKQSDGIVAVGSKKPHLIICRSIISVIRCLIGWRLS